MEQIPQPKNNKEKIITKLEILFSDLGAPRQTVSIRVDGKNEPSFLVGFGKFFRAIPMEKFQRIFPYLVESSEENELKLKPRSLIKLLDDKQGLRELSQYLQIPVEIIKESRGRVLERQIVNFEK